MSGERPPWQLIPGAKLGGHTGLKISPAKFQNFSSFFGSGVVAQ